MHSAAMLAFPDQAGPAQRLAQALGAPFAGISVHRFPDGEILPTAIAPAAVGLVYASLNDPNEKLIALMLAADALRRGGCRRLVLVAPYLCYMRQDRVFRLGEPVSRDVVCGLLGRAFDRVVTVEAHMHRTLDLPATFGGIKVDNLSAAEPLAGAYLDEIDAVIVGPDAESAPWAKAIAERRRAESIIFDKVRRGDVAVRVSPPDLSRLGGRPTIIVDDICATGGTLAAVAKALVKAGAASVDAAVVHALFDPSVEARLAAAGVRRIVSTDTITHPTNAAPIGPMLIAALRNEVTP